MVRGLFQARAARSAPTSAGKDSDRLRLVRSFHRLRRLQVAQKLSHHREQLVIGKDDHALGGNQRGRDVELLAFCVQEVDQRTLTDIIFFQCMR